MYDSADFDFSSGAFKTGGEANGSVVKRFNYAYTYGAAESGKPSFDTTPYFASSVTAAIQGTKTGSANIINAGENINELGYNDFVNNPLVITPTPSSALDSWEYIINASSDESKVYYDKDHDGEKNNLIPFRRYKKKIKK